MCLPGGCLPGGCLPGGCLPRGTGDICLEGVCLMGRVGGGVYSGRGVCAGECLLGGGISA